MRLHRAGNLMRGANRERWGLGKEEEGEHSPSPSQPPEHKKIMKNLAGITSDRLPHCKRPHPFGRRR